MRPHARALCLSQALHCLSQGLLRHFHQCIDEAYQDVLKYVSEAKEFVESVDVFSNQLATFEVALHENVDNVTFLERTWNVTRFAPRIA